MLHFCRAGGGVPVFQVDSGAELLGCEQMCCSLFRTRCNRQQPAPALHSPHLAVQPLTPPRRVCNVGKPATAMSLRLYMCSNTDSREKGGL